MSPKSPKPMNSAQTEWLFGFHVIEALLKNKPDLIIEIFALNTREDARMQALQDQALARRLPFKRLSRAELSALCPASGHASNQAAKSGLIARCYAYQGLDESVLRDLVQDLPSPKLLLVLDGVQDPHNLGACLRSANGLGVQAVITTKDRACGLTPVVRKVASGAAEATPFFQVTNLSRCLDWLKEQGVWLVGLEGETDSAINSLDLRLDIALVVGNEGKGLRQLTRKQCDFLAKIPMHGSVESFNVSVATALGLYEITRQRN